jgi:hypothetical protein
MNMNVNALLRSFCGAKWFIAIAQAKGCRGFRPMLDMLEDRLAPAAFLVNSTLDTDDGLALNAVTTLRKAIRLANATPAADTIAFAAALTNQTITLGGTQLPVITEPVTITGPGSTKLTIDANNASRIFYITDGSNSQFPVSISGLKLTHGFANAANGGAIANGEALTLGDLLLDHNSAGLFGGSVYNIGSLTIANSNFTFNFAANGGGIYNNAGTLSLTNSTLSNNTLAPDGDGGGIYSTNGTLTLTNATLSNNAARGGAGVYLLAGTLTLKDSHFTSNSAFTSGGGIFNGAATLVLTNSTFNGNQAAGNAGGAIRNDSGAMTLTNMTLSGNSASNAGGGIYNNAGTMTLTGSTLDHNIAQLGGGTYVVAGALNMTDSHFTGNTGFTSGGGIFNGAATLVLNNSNFTGNQANTNAGGGIRNDSGAMTLTNMTLSGNAAGNAGGGIYNNTGAVTLTNSTLSTNSASTGGGIFNSTGTLTVTNLTLAGNSASAGGGGGIFNTGTVTLSNSTLSANYAYLFGGGIDSDNGGNLTVTNSTFTANIGNNGGAIYSAGTSFTLTNSTLSANTGYKGGGIYENSGSVYVAYSTLAGNSAAVGGGGAFEQAGDFYLINSTVSANSASNGGGIEADGLNLFVANCTIVANHADTYDFVGGGIFSGLCNVYLTDTIVAGNWNSGTPCDLGIPFYGLERAVANLIGDPNSSSWMTNGGNGNIVGKNGGINLLPLAEILDPTLRNNGGPTLTHALVRFSPAIDAGDNSVFSGIPFDQRGRGFNRIVNGGVDIGAFEMSAPFFTDGFSGPPRPLLGGPWISQAGALGVVGVMEKVAEGTGASGVNVATLAGAAVGDVDVYARLSLGLNQQAGVLARYTGAGDKNYYLASLSSDADGSVTARIVRNANGVVTELAVVEAVGTGDGTLHFRLVGSTLQLFLNGTLLATVEDTTFKSGSIGMRTTGITFLDDFQAFPVSTGVDNFDYFTHPNYTTLSDPWTQPEGFYRTFGNQIQGGQALNLAIINAAQSADVDVRASVSITGLNHTAGLLARYLGHGDTNYYLASLSRTSTGFVVNVRKNVGGIVTPLATTNIVSTTGKANLRFLVTGIDLRVFVNNIPVVNVLDNSLTTGSVGIRSDAYATLDDFRATAVTTDLPFFDNFTQPDNDSLGDHWTRRAGDFNVMSQAVVGTSASPAVNLATVVGVNQANVSIDAEVAVTTTSSEVGLLAAYAGPGDTNYYMARVVKTAAGVNLSIIKNIRGVVTTLKSVNLVALTGVLGFQAVGSSLKVFINGFEQFAAIDSTLTSGNVGIRCVGMGTIGSFAVSAPLFLPFHDAFTAIPGPDLGSNWITRAGGYTTAAAPAIGKAKGTAALNLATLGRFDLANAVVQANINVPNTTGQFASLAARYSGAGDLNMYLATIAWNGTNFVASISKKVDGVTTVLASATTASGASLLEFDVIGSELSLAFGGLVFSVSDFSLKSGSVGIRSSLGSTFDDFNADQAN